MKLSRAIVSAAMALVLLSFVNVAWAQYPPVWTDILNMRNQWSMASGNYFDVGSGQAPILNTDITGITNAYGASTPNILAMPANITYLYGNGTQGGPVNCNNSTGYPLAFIESNAGSGIKGVGFLGSFNSPYPLNNLSGNIFQAVFFNTNQCYMGGREYGFFLATYDNSIWAYWGTNENQPSVVQGQVPLNAANNVLGNGVTIQPNTQYYYEMYPRPGYGSCSFQIAIYNTNFQIVFSASPPITSYGATNLLNVDPNFCTDMANTTGYVSANITPASGSITGSLPSSGLYLSMQRVFVGK